MDGPHDLTIHVIQFNIEQYYKTITLKEQIMGTIVISNIVLFVIGEILGEIFNP